LLHAVGLSELVTSTLEDYETLAIRLARDPRRLASIRARLQHNRDKCPLFSSRLSTEYIEAAYTKMYQNHLSGHLPGNFAIQAQAAPRLVNVSPANDYGSFS
jgi:protein O-GlcNAc transferase